MRHEQKWGEKKIRFHNKRRAARWTLAMKICMFKISWDNDAYLTDVRQPKWKKEMAVQGALFIITLSSNRAKENSAKQDGKRSGWKGSGPQRGLIARLTGKELTSEERQLPHLQTNTLDRARNQSKHRIQTLFFSLCHVSSPWTSPLLLVPACILSFGHPLSSCLHSLTVLLCSFSMLQIFTLISCLPISVGQQSP